MEVLKTMKQLASLDNVRKVLKATYEHRGTIAKVVGYTTLGLAVATAVKEAPKAVHEIEKEAEKKGELLTPVEKGSIIFKTMPTVFMLSAVSVGTMLYSDVTITKEIRKVKNDNASLVEQVIGLSNAYNAINDVSAGVRKFVTGDDPGLIEEFNASKTQVKIDREKELYSKLNDPSSIKPDISEHMNKYELLYTQTEDPIYKMLTWKEETTGRVFEACTYQVDAALETLKTMQNSPNYGKGFVNQNDFWREIGISETRIGDMLIFRAGKEPIGASKNAIVDDDGVTPIMLLSWDVDPYCDSGDYYGSSWL